MIILPSLPICVFLISLSLSPSLLTENLIAYCTDEMPTYILTHHIYNTAFSLPLWISSRFLPKTNPSCGAWITSFLDESILFNSVIVPYLLYCVISLLNYTITLYAIASIFSETNKKQTKPSLVLHPSTATTPLLGFPL